MLTSKRHDLTPTAGCVYKIRAIRIEIVETEAGDSDGASNLRCAECDIGLNEARIRECVQGHKTFDPYTDALQFGSGILAPRLEGLKQSWGPSEDSVVDVEGILPDEDAAGFMSELFVRDHRERPGHGGTVPPSLGRNKRIPVLHFARLDADSDRLAAEKCVAIDPVAKLCRKA